jgi:hypothetical protein
LSPAKATGLFIQENRRIRALPACAGSGYPRRLPSRPTKSSPHIITLIKQVFDFKNIKTCPQTKNLSSIHIFDTITIVGEEARVPYLHETMEDQNAC